jgi:hypothetical protein
VVKFFRSEDVSDLAQCMISLIKDQESRDRFAASALSFVNDYSWNRKQWEYFEIVDRLVERNPLTGK